MGAGCSGVAGATGVVDNGVIGGGMGAASCADTPPPSIIIEMARVLMQSFSIAVGFLIFTVLTG